MVLYLLGLSMLPHELAYVNVSRKCAAAVYVACVTLGIRDYWTKTPEFFTGYALVDLEDTVLTIHRYHRAAEESSLKSDLSSSDCCSRVCCFLCVLLILRRKPRIEISNGGENNEMRMTREKWKKAVTMTTMTTTTTTRD
jgi:hypothetical protein